MVARPSTPSISSRMMQLGRDCPWPCPCPWLDKAPLWVSAPDVPARAKLLVVSLFSSFAAAPLRHDMGARRGV